MHSAFDFDTGRLYDEHENPNILITQVLNQKTRVLKSWALREFQEPGAAFKRPQTIINFEKPTWHPEKVPCLTICAGVFQLPLIAFPTMKFTEALNAMTFAKSPKQKAAA